MWAAASEAQKCLQAFTQLLLSEEEYGAVLDLLAETLQGSLAAGWHPKLPVLREHVLALRSLHRQLLQGLRTAMALAPVGVQLAPVLLGVLICSAVLVVVINILTDVVYRMIDPRIRVGGSS